jgi:hypothetical protein
MVCGREHAPCFSSWAGIIRWSSKVWVNTDSVSTDPAVLRRWTLNDPMYFSVHF